MSDHSLSCVTEKNSFDLFFVKGQMKGKVNAGNGKEKHKSQKAADGNNFGGGGRCSLGGTPRLE